MTWHTLCGSDELPVGEMKSFIVDKHKIVLYHLSDGFFATQGAVTGAAHSGWGLAIKDTPIIAA